MTDAAHDTLALMETIKRLTMQRDAGVAALDQIDNLNLRLTSGQDRAYSILSNALARIAELGKDMPHPWYGPCDALGPNGECAECLKAEPWDGKERRVDERRVNPTAVRVPGKNRRKPQPDDADWIEWHGGKCPALDGMLFQMKFRSGRLSGKYRDASTWNWGDDDAWTIIAYRILPGDEG